MRSASLARILAGVVPAQGRPALCQTRRNINERNPQPPERFYTD